jgi:hypothetical protein
VKIINLNLSLTEESNNFMKKTFIYFALIMAVVAMFAVCGICALEARASVNGAEQVLQSPQLAEANPDVSVLNDSAKLSNEVKDANVSEALLNDLITLL